MGPRRRTITRQNTSPGGEKEEIDDTEAVPGVANATEDATFLGDGSERLVEEFQIATDSEG